MASKKRKVNVDIEKSSSSSSSAVSSALPSVNEDTLLYSAKFLHGSADSRDTDVIYVIESSLAFPSRPQLVNFCRGSDEDRNVVQLGRENSASGDWYVQKAFRGAPDEVNNALLTTHRKAPNSPSYELLVTQKCCRSVLLRYFIAAKAIVLRMRRIEACRNDCIAALASWDFSKLLSVAHTSCTRQFDALTRDAAKYVAFHLAQSYLLSNGIEFYTKQEMVGLMPELQDITYFQGGNDDPIPKEHVQILKTLETKWHAQTVRIYCSPPFDKVYHLQSVHLDTSGGPRVAHNYLEVDCGGTVLDVQEERLVALASPIPLKIASYDLASSSASLSPVLQYPSTWPSDILLVDDAIAIDEMKKKRFLFSFLPFNQWRVFSDLDRHAPTSQSSNKKTHPNSKSKKSSKSDSEVDEASKPVIDSILLKLEKESVTSTDSFVSVVVSEGKLLELVVRSRLTLRKREVSWFDEAKCTEKISLQVRSKV